MQTPYKILQLKQKQEKKIISDHKIQRSFSIRYNKNGDHATQYLIQREKLLSCNNQRNWKQSSKTIQKQYSNNKKCTNSDKKYEIVFRQSIRKVNTYRTKVYHTHDSIKKQKLHQKIIATERQIQNFRHQTFKEKQHNSQISKTGNKSLQNNCSQDKCETMRVGKYKILLKKSPYIYDQNQIIPQISGERCKLNLNFNQNKLKIQNTIQSLYHHNKKMQTSKRKVSLESCFTECDDFIQQPKNKRIDLNMFEASSHQKKIKRSPCSTTDIQKNISNTFEEFRFQIEDKNQTINQTNVANFIKSKKKKRLPISLLKTPKHIQGGFCSFRRTVTDEFSNKSKQTTMKDIQERYFSPNKHSRCGAKIKFNTIQQNISGWQSIPFEISYLNQQNILKSPQLQN